MTSAYITAALARCRLPIQVEAVPFHDPWSDKEAIALWIDIGEALMGDPRWDAILPTHTDRPAEAKKRYLALVHQLESAVTPAEGVSIASPGIDAPAPT